MLVKKYAFFCTQGTLILDKNLYIKRQGSTAENGGQVIYALEIAKAAAKLGHSVDIYSRNYGNEDFAQPHEVMIETMADHPLVRVIHVPTIAPGKVEKEHFYPYYNEYLTRAFEVMKNENYDYLVGHYADGMFMTVVAEEMLFKNDGRRRATLGITHSLGKDKAYSILEKLKSEMASQKEVIRKIYLSGKFRRVSHAFNLKPRLSCERAAIKRLDGIMPVSRAHLELLHSNYSYPKKRMKVIAGGINQNIFYSLELSAEQKQSKRAELIESHIAEIKEERRTLLQNGKIMIGFGRMILNKGIVESVKAMKQVLEQHADSTYVYIGGNIPPKTTEEKEVYSRCMNFAREHGYEDRIIFLGRQNQEKINAWLNIADVYVHAAHPEAFGLAPQEAASTGIPVIMSQLAGARDVLKNNEHVLYIHPLKPDDIAEKINLLLSDHTLATRISKHARKYVMKECTWLARARAMDAFCARIERNATTRRLYALNKKFTENENLRAASALLFQQPDHVVAEELRSTFHTIRHLMEKVLFSYPVPQKLPSATEVQFMPDDKALKQYIEMIAQEHLENMKVA